MPQHAPSPRSTPDFESWRKIIRELLAVAAEADGLGAREQAYTTLASAVETAVRSGWRELRSEVENALGNHYGKYREFEEQLIHCRRAVRLLGPAGDPVKRGIALTNLGSCLTFLGRYAEALEYLWRAADLMMERTSIEDYLRTVDGGRLRYTISTIYSIANVLHSVRDYRGALDILDDLLCAIEGTGSPADPDVTGLAASCRIELGELEAARELLLRQLGASHGVHDPRSHAMALSGMACVAEKSDALEDALRWAQAALEHATPIQDPFRVAEASCTIARLEISRGAFSEAESHCRSALLALEGRELTEVRHRAHDLLAQSLEARGDLSAANRELRAALHTLRSAENNAKLASIVRAVQEREARFSRRKLEHERLALTRDISSTPLAVNTALGNDDALTALAARFPELTAGELRIAALLRGGLRTKEIAAMLNVSRHTVDGHRTTLRKKLGIAPEDDLLTALLRLTPQINGHP